jgi:hypothetical protein
MVARVANLPSPQIPWMNADGTPTQAFRNWVVPFASLGFGPFVQAANDAAAAKAGVAVGGVYQDTTTGYLRGRIA